MDAFGFPVMTGAAGLAKVLGYQWLQAGRPAGADAYYVVVKRSGATNDGMADAAGLPKTMALPWNEALAVGFVGAPHPPVPSAAEREAERAKLAASLAAVPDDPPLPGFWDEIRDSASGLAPSIGIGTSVGLVVGLAVVAAVLVLLASR